MKRMIIFAAVLALAAPAAFADDLIPPPWDRFDPGTTYAEWDTWGFEIPDDHFLADSEFNPYGTPEVVDYVGFAEVLPEYDGRPEVLHTTDGDWLELHIPNNPVPNDYKDIYLQIVWNWDGAPDVPDVYIPSSGATISITDEFALESNWWYTRYHIHIEPNPDFEEIDIWPADAFGDLYIDQIVIDTICIPEPTSLALLALGGLALIRRR